MGKVKAGWRGRLLHPAVVLPVALAALLAVAVLWYPPLRQPSYSPADTAPFFEAAAEGVDINHAGLAELTALPGIGPAKAQAILDYREEHGPFAQAEDLLEVSGIGPATLEGFEELIVFCP